MGLDLVKHEMGETDIQNKRGVVRVARDHAETSKTVYSSWDLSSSGGQAITYEKSWIACRKAQLEGE